MANTPLQPAAADGGLSNRERILETAIRAFGEHGYEGASTNQICAAAGISKGLLFHYFKSKENLFMAVLDRCGEELTQCLQREELSQRQTPLESLTLFYQKVVDFFSRHPNHYRIMVQLPQGHSEALDRFAQEKKEEFMNALSLGVRLYLSRSAVRPGVDREIALEMITQLVIYLQNKYITGISQMEIPLEEGLRLMQRELSAALDIISYGVLLPAGF